MPPLFPSWPSLFRGTRLIFFWKDSRTAQTLGPVLIIMGHQLRIAPLTPCYLTSSTVFNVVTSRHFPSLLPLACNPPQVLLGGPDPLFLQPRIDPWMQRSHHAGDDGSIPRGRRDQIRSVTLGHLSPRILLPGPIRPDAEFSQRMRATMRGGRIS